MLEKSQCVYKSYRTLIGCGKLVCMWFLRSKVTTVKKRLLYAPATGTTKDSPTTNDWCYPFYSKDQTYDHKRRQKFREYMN